MKLYFANLAIILGILFISLHLVHSAEEPKKLSEEEIDALEEKIAAQLANPNTVLGTLNFNLDYISYKGDLPNSSDQEAWRLLFQPSLPYPVAQGVNFFFRPAVPLIFKQDVPNFSETGLDPSNKSGVVIDEDTFGNSGFRFRDTGMELGDISFDAGIGKSFTNGMVMIGGMVGTLPTATDDALGLDQWLLGPEFALAKVSKAGVLGLLVTHQWDIAGEDDYSTSITGGQYFYTLNLSDGWTISSNPTFSYNHKADSGDKWTLPLGVGVNKTTILNGRP